MDTESIKTVLKGTQGQALKRYLLSKLNEMKSIEYLNELSTTSAQALEVKAQLRAYKKLKEILSELMDISEEAKQKKPEDSYAVE